MRADLPFREVGIVFGSLAFFSLDSDYYSLSRSHLLLYKLTVTCAFLTVVSLWCKDHIAPEIVGSSHV